MAKNPKAKCTEFNCKVLEIKELVKPLDEDD
jgi:hypothetical protein